MTGEELSRRQLLGAAGVLCTVGLVGGAGTHALLTDDESFEGNLIQASELDLQVACRTDAGEVDPPQTDGPFPSTYADAGTVDPSLTVTAGTERTLTVALQTNMAAETGLEVRGDAMAETGATIEVRHRGPKADGLETIAKQLEATALPTTLDLGRCGPTDRPRMTELTLSVPPDAPTDSQTMTLEFTARQCTD
ncbi:SipW-dependent-type signal peptide-containing protein [Haloarchaeobius amylolyticus]|uniref:SipW-dependent-type signal peptide-containing protein n=1 Tax=Haloarchaeobius amylolyticus TaxID=1198296 RepID=UPI00226E166C|nr:SipW-dependent-type signal peptide-containing protein [Haloarchaeobius amylolyticus]